MAYVNVAEWKTDQVCEWLKGLDNSVLPYVHSFTNNKVNGQQLLSLRPEDLEQLGVLKLGHQEIILEAVEYLRNFHYELDRENLQLLALRLSCQAHSLHNELSRQTDSKPVTTQTLSDVVGVVTAVKPLVRWLDRPPFCGQLEYNDKKTQLLKLSIEMATCAQRDRFAEKPIEEIRTTCGELAKLADYVIQDISDPMILQPASLDLATLKKRPGDDLGFFILPSFHGTHQIAEIKFSSVAHQCGKMEEGDEIVQVNYQTVVGWERKNVLELFNESPAEVLLTLKRRPRHTKVYGQIYIKPYRLPSNKKTPYATRWQHNLPSPRPELLTIPDFTMPLPRHAPKDPSPEPASIISTVMLDTMATDSSDSDSEVEPPLSVRLYASKPRSLVQRRATITGASPTSKHAIDIEQFWKELKQEHSTTFQLRDKAASCAHGLDTVPSNLRPQTCLGIEQTKRKKKFDEEKKFENEVTSDVDSTRNNNEAECVSESKTIDIEEKPNDDGNINGEKSNNGCDTTVPLTKYDDIGNNSTVNDRDTIDVSEIEKYCRRERGKLDKSHSTPAYDLTDANPVEIIDASNQTNITVDTNNTNSIKVVKTDTKIKSDNLEVEKSLKNTELIETIKMEGNVAQKVNFIEEKFRENNNIELRTNNSKVPDVNKSSNMSNEFEKLKKDQSDSESICTDKIDEPLNTNTLSPLSEVKKISDSYASSRETSEEKSESTSSYMEGIYSSSSEADAPLVKFEQTTSLVLTEKNKTSDINGKVSLMSPLNITNKIHVGSDAKENLSPQITVSPSIFTKRDNKSEENKKECTPPPQRQVMDTKHGVKKCEAKARLTPPEPPPRKYFTKPSPLNLNISVIPPEPPERPKVPERADIKREIRRTENRSNTETIVALHQQESFEGYRDFIEKSTDFIDEPNTPVNECRPSVDHFAYSDIYDRQTKDDKTVLERYEPFTEKFGNGSALIVQSQPEIVPRTADSPDGAGCSAQRSQTPELKPRTLEKDKHSEKGVVNRAMMVARSIGLHSASKLSSSSPRSSRKRNMLLAKRRNVSVKDIGPGDLEGWLTYRSRGAGGAWAKSWFILKGSSLYRFKNQESIKSDCLIALPGFTASQASEVKSRKYAFKVYHTGTVFYFAADTEDSLAVWLDSINKVTLGADSHFRCSGLFSETDESDSETKVKNKSPPVESKSASEKGFGSLKKLGRKDSGAKDHDVGGASLDRKYLRFLGSRTQNVPVPTAQFRSYRRVLPSSTPNKKPESASNSPDLRVTVAGSTFYGLTSSHSATDVPTTSQDMGDYRQTTDRSQSTRSRRPDDLRGFVTLEEFMLSHQHEDRQRSISNRSASPRLTPITNDHVHVQYRQYDDNNVIYGQNRGFSSGFASNGMIYGHPRNGEESPNVNRPYGYPRNPGGIITPDRSEAIYGQRSDNVNFNDDATEARSYERPSSIPRKPWNSVCRYGKRPQEDVVYYPPKSDSSHWQNISNEIAREHRVNSPSRGKNEIRQSSRDTHILPTRIFPRNEPHNDEPPQPAPRRFIRDNGYSGSSGDLTCCTSSETLQRVRKEASVSRKGSFNLNDRHREDKNWIDSLRRSDKKLGSSHKARLKNVAQYQPPPIPSSPFEQDGMRAAFEMHLDKGEHVQKPSRLKSLFGSKSPQKPSTLDLPKEQQKTLLGSPRLHRALFRDKSSGQKHQATRSGSQSPGDSGISQSLSSYSGISQSYNLSQSFSSVSSVSDWSPDTPSVHPAKYAMGHAACQKRVNARNLLNPPTLPYIPPPSSPPPDDYPGLEYPPVFEPGTYSLSDASLLRGKSRVCQNESEDG